MVKKDKLYRTLIERMELAANEGRDLEAGWYAYAVIEDRTRSLLKSSGGIPVDSHGNQIRMLGAKTKELKKRAKQIPRLKAGVDFPQLKAWTKNRNDLIHGMAEGSLTVEDIDRIAKKVALDGPVIARGLATTARKLKKYKK